VERVRQSLDVGQEVVSEFAHNPGAVLAIHRDGEVNTLDLLQLIRHTTRVTPKPPWV